MRRILTAVGAIVVGGAVLIVAPSAQSVPATADSYGLVDPSTGIWRLYDGGTQTTQFYFGDPGDYPFMGDWNCDSVDTPGLYRQSDGYVYLRNSNTQGIADVSFYFGDPGDVPIAGDFNADGCDTVSIYRPSEQRFYIINKLGSKDGGLGAADYSYVFGNPGDQPFVGDFNGNGQDTPGLHRASTGLVYYRNSNTTGIADNSFIYGDPGDRFVTGDWTANGVDSPGLFRPSNSTVYLRYENSQGNADVSWMVGSAGWLPVAGQFVAPPPPAKGSIVGTVTDKGTGTPLGGITVEAKLPGTAFFKGGDTTAPDGTYEIHGLNPGDYDVYFEDHTGVYVDAAVEVAVIAGTTTTIDVEMVSWVVVNCQRRYTYCISGTLEVDQLTYPDGAANKSGDFDHLPTADGIEFGLGFEATPTSCSSMPFDESTRRYSITEFGLAFRGDEFLAEEFGPAVTSIGSVDIMYLTERFGDIDLGIHLADTSVTGYTFEVSMYGLDLNIESDGCPVLAPLPAARTQTPSDRVIFRNFTLNYFETPGGYFQDFASGPADLGLR
jgi:hypothetical protein